MRKPKTRQSHPVLGRSTDPATISTAKVEMPYKPNVATFEVKSVNQKRMDELLGGILSVFEPPPRTFIFRPQFIPFIHLTEILVGDGTPDTEIIVDSQESQESQQSQISITDMLLPDPSLLITPPTLATTDESPSIPSSSSNSQSTIQSQSNSQSSQTLSSTSSLMQVDGPAPSPFAVRSSSASSVSSIVPTPNSSQSTQPNPPVSPSSSYSYSSIPLYPQQVPVTLSYQSTAVTSAVSGPSQTMFTTHPTMTSTTPQIPQSNPFTNKPTMVSSGSALTYDSFWSSMSATQNYRHLLGGMNGANGMNPGTDIGSVNGNVSGPSAGTS